ncbi:MAG: thioesterase family protein [Gammaproteobacteria bacterium]|nr:thioesterase family protein [Gammaproteobacteria bacterium]
MGVYEYQTTVTIGDTNALQNMYFLNFFKLQGIVRELWVKDEVEGGFEDLSNGMILITKDARCNFKKNFFLYDEVVVKLYISNVGRTNMRLNFMFYNMNTGELHAEGNQTIVFANSTHRIIAIPDNWKRTIQQFSHDTDIPEVCEV